MQARMSKHKAGQQGWRWVHEAADKQRSAPARNRAHWFVLIVIGIGLNVGLTVLSSM